MTEHVVDTLFHTEDDTCRLISIAVGDFFHSSYGKLSKEFHDVYIKIRASDVGYPKVRNNGTRPSGQWSQSNWCINLSTLEREVFNGTMYVYPHIPTREQELMTIPFLE